MLQAADGREFVSLTLGAEIREQLADFKKSLDRQELALTFWRELEFAIIRNRAFILSLGKNCVTRFLAGTQEFRLVARTADDSPIQGGDGVYPGRRLGGQVGAPLQKAAETPERHRLGALAEKIREMVPGITPEGFPEVLRPQRPSKKIRKRTVMRRNHRRNVGVNARAVVYTQDLESKGPPSGGGHLLKPEELVWIQSVVPGVVRVYHHIQHNQAGTDWPKVCTSLLSNSVLLVVKSGNRKFAVLKNSAVKDQTRVWLISLDARQVLRPRESLNWSFCVEEARGPHLPGRTPPVPRSYQEDLYYGSLINRKGQRSGSGNEGAAGGGRPGLRPPEFRPGGAGRGEGHLRELLPWGDQLR